MDKNFLGRDDGFVNFGIVKQLYLVFVFPWISCIFLSCEQAM